MAKWAGKIGFATQTETKPGVWEDVITEKSYKGDELKNSFQHQPTDQLHDKITIVNRISVIANPYAYKHVQAMRYATFMGEKWEIKHVEVLRPRLILTLGGEYNAQQA